jgi:hypothetical protein
MGLAATVYVPASGWRESCAPAQRLGACLEFEMTRLTSQPLPKAKKRVQLSTYAMLFGEGDSEFDAS